MSPLWGPPACQHDLRSLEPMTAAGTSDSRVRPGTVQGAGGGGLRVRGWTGCCVRDKSRQRAAAISMRRLRAAVRPTGCLCDRPQPRRACVCRRSALLTPGQGMTQAAEKGRHRHTQTLRGRAEASDVGSGHMTGQPRQLGHRTRRLTMPSLCTAPAQCLSFGQCTLSHVGCMCTISSCHNEPAQVGNSPLP